MGLFLAWKFRKQTKLEFIHSNRTQTGARAFSDCSKSEDRADTAITLAIPLALNFMASGECSCCLQAAATSKRYETPSEKLGVTH